MGIVGLTKCKAANIMGYLYVQVIIRFQNWIITRLLISIFISNFWITNYCHQRQLKLSCLLTIPSCRAPPINRKRWQDNQHMYRHFFYPRPRYYMVLIHPTFLLVGWVLAYFTIYHKSNAYIVFSPKIPRYSFIFYVNTCFTKHVNSSYSTCRFTLPADIARWYCK